MRLLTRVVVPLDIVSFGARDAVLVSWLCGAFEVELARVVIYSVWRREYIFLAVSGCVVTNE